MQNRITAFDTVEDFWSLYNHIRVASDIGNGNDYSLFKRNIRPMWEDEVNKRGGRWLMMLGRQHKRLLDQFWLDIVLCLIGEAFENSDDICGAVVNIRPRGDKIGEFELCVCGCGCSGYTFYFLFLLLYNQPSGLPMATTGSRSSASATRSRRRWICPTTCRSSTSCTLPASTRHWSRCSCCSVHITVTQHQQHWMMNFASPKYSDE